MTSNPHWFNTSHVLLTLYTQSSLDTPIIQVSSRYLCEKRPAKLDLAKIVFIIFVNSCSAEERQLEIKLNLFKKKFSVKLKIFSKFTSNIHSATFYFARQGPRVFKVHRCDLEGFSHFSNRHFCSNS